MTHGSFFCSLLLVASSVKLTVCYAHGTWYFFSILLLLGLICSFFATVLFFCIEHAPIDKNALFHR